MIRIALYELTGLAYVQTAFALRRPFAGVTGSRLVNFWYSSNKNATRLASFYQLFLPPMADAGCAPVWNWAQALSTACAAISIAAYAVLKRATAQFDSEV